MCTPLDAIRCFIRSQIDLLVLEDFVLERSGIPAFWEALSHFDNKVLSDSRGMVEHSVYTLL